MQKVCMPIQKPELGSWFHGSEISDVGIQALAQFFLQNTQLWYELHIAQSRSDTEVFEVISH